MNEQSLCNIVGVTKYAEVRLYVMSKALCLLFNVRDYVYGMGLYKLYDCK